MVYWYSRKRGVIISDHKYIFMAPRFKCACGKSRTMHPYFIVPRKQYSIFSIQKILNADISGNRRETASYGSSMVSNLRKWAVALAKNILTDLNENSFKDERSTVSIIYEQYGLCWLSSILQKKSGSIPFDIYPCLTG